MKRYALITIFLLTSFSSRAADTLITKLINAVYLERVDTAAKYYYLIDSAITPQFDKYDLEELKLEKRLLTDVPFDDFIANIKRDTIKLYWRNFGLTKARCINSSEILHYSYSIRIYRWVRFDTAPAALQALADKNIIPVLAKARMSKQEIKKAKEAATKKYEDRPIEEKKWYSFSKPIFSNDRQYVLISLNEPEHGCIYIFKLVNGSWTRILTYGCWVS